MHSELFLAFSKKFPEQAFTLLHNSYGSAFDFISLKSQLKVVHMPDDFKNLTAIEILKFLNSNEMIKMHIAESIIYVIYC